METFKFIEKGSTEMLEDYLPMYDSEPVLDYLEEMKDSVESISNVYILIQFVLNLILQITLSLLWGLINPI